ncbi:MAG: hypothetical protein HDQ88_06430 [Clostridia bacterium]|nr:hypothetical protein [Clostridia bacterium]
MYTDQILEHWKADNPDCTPVALFDCRHDAIEMDRKGRTDYAMYCEGFGLTLDDLDTKVTINGKTCKLHSINTRKTKYKIVWAYLDDPGRYIRTTPAYARWLLDEATGTHPI